MSRRIVCAMLAVAFAAAGCGGSAAVRTSPPGSAAAPTVGPAIAQARSAVERALGARRIQVHVPQAPYRPAEAPEVARANRLVLQAILPDDADAGYITLYDFATESAAVAAAEAQAEYVASSVGRVYFPVGTQFVVRRLGRTVIFYADSPALVDDQAPDVVEALQTIGSEVTVPS